MYSKRRGKARSFSQLMKKGECIRDSGIAEEDVVVEPREMATVVEP